MTDDGNKSGKFGGSKKLGENDADDQLERPEIDEGGAGNGDADGVSNGFGNGDGGGEPPPPPTGSVREYPVDDVLLRDAAAGRFRLTLIGFPAAGKTHFLNRLKHSFETKPWHGAPFSGRLSQGLQRFWSSAAGYVVDPPSVDDIQPTSGEWAHYFRWIAQEGDTNDEVPISVDPDDDDGGSTSKVNPRSFVIYDVAGEALRQATEEGLPGRLYDIIANSDALIVLLPSNFVLAADKGVGGLAVAILDHANIEKSQNQKSVNPVSQDFSTRVEQRAARKRREKDRSHGVGLDTLIADLDRIDTDEAYEEEVSKYFVEQRKWIQNFRRNLKAIITTSSLLRSADVTYDEFVALTEEERVKLYNTEVSKPLAYFALSKGDTVFSNNAPIVPLHQDIRDLFLDAKGNPLPEAKARDLLDTKPEKVFAVANDPWFDNIRGLFSSFKVDFLTSIQPPQHGPFMVEPTNLYGDADAELEQPSFGVDAVVEWIQYARQRRSHSGGKLSRRWKKLWLKVEPFELAISRAGKWGSILIGLVLCALVIMGGIFTSNWTSGRSDAASSNRSAKTSLQSDPRYVSEVNYLQRQHEFFVDGRPVGVIRPWSYIPTNGEAYFTTIAGTPLRGTYEGVLAKTKNWSLTGPVSPAAVREVTDALDNLQGSEEARSRQQGGPVASRRSFSYYHMGLARFRGGDFAAAAQEFDGLDQVLAAERPSNDEGRKRVLGMRIATLHAKGVSQLFDEDVEPLVAQETLQRAVSLIPAMGSPDRAMVTTKQSNFHIPRSQKNRSPAQFSTLDIYADLLTAQIRNFSADRDLAEASEVSQTFELLSRYRTEFPVGHKLATNHAMVGALLGRPLQDIPTAGGVTSQEGAVAIGIAEKALGGDGVWAVIRDLRESFSKGEATDVGELIKESASNENLIAPERTLVASVAEDIVSDARERYRASGSGELLAPYVGKVPSFTDAELARDLAGGDVLYYLKSYLPWLFFGPLGLFLFWLGVRAAEASDVQTSLKHRKDRLKQAKKDKKRQPIRDDGGDENDDEDGDGYDDDAEDD